MKKLSLLLLLSVFVFCGCSDDDDDIKNEVVVSFEKKLTDAESEFAPTGNQPTGYDVFEGSYLLPDMKNGFGYLNAVKRVMNGEYENFGNKN